MSVGVVWLEVWIACQPLRLALALRRLAHKLLVEELLEYVATVNLTHEGAKILHEGLESMWVLPRVPLVSGELKLLQRTLHLRVNSFIYGGCI